MVVVVGCLDCALAQNVNADAARDPMTAKDWILATARWSSTAGSRLTHSSAQSAHDLGTDYRLGPWQRRTRKLRTWRVAGSHVLSVALACHRETRNNSGDSEGAAGVPRLALGRSPC